MNAQQTALRQQCRHPSGEVAEIAHAETEQSVIARFARMVAAYPDKPAIVDPTKTLTYAELDQASNRIARTIQQRGGQIDEPVAILMEDGIEKLAAIYGATKAGMCYAVLPPETPEERLSFMLQDMEYPLLLTDSSNREMASSLVSRGVDLLFAEEALQNASADPIQIAIDPDTRYFIRYTSGSTGRPKGILSTHRDYLVYIRNNIWAIQFCAQDRRTGFDNNSSAAVATIQAGATFFEFDFRHSGLAALTEGIARQSITVISATVTAFRQLVRSAFGRFTYPDLRVIQLIGEPSMGSDIVATRGLFSSKCVFVNLFGATESGTATTYCASQETAVGLENLPAGYPVENKEILLWDEKGKPVADGEIGEIVVRSPYLSQGYWNRPALTRERFRPDPEGSDRRIYFTGDLGRRDHDGCLYYLGRKDQQVKIRGHRIEISEVEAELLALDGVKMAAVDARPGPNGDLRLVAYVVPAREGLVVGAMRQALGQRLPLAMLPAAFVFLEQLPLTTSQKVDRRALPDPGRQRPPLAVDYIAPRTPVEAELAQIWADVLGLEEVGIHDNFLDLGGDSLLASQVVTRVIHTLRVDLPLATLFGAPTVADMALLVTVALLADSASNQFEVLFNV